MSIQITLARWYLILRYGKSRTPRYILLTVGAAILAQILRKIYKFSRRKCKSFYLRIYQYSSLVNGLTVKKASKRSALNAKFFQEFQDILKIMVPGWFSREVGIIGIHSAILMSRTFLSIFVAALEGRIIKAIVQKNVSQFSLLMLKWFLVAVPACAINSLIRFFDSYIGLVLRKRLVQHAYAKYFQNDVYYKVSNLDTRLLNVDQCLTEDITTLSNQVAHLYSQITKPLFDIGLIT
jgi:ATP-binding cassette subfamily D (ALD) protein 2